MPDQSEAVPTSQPTPTPSQTKQPITSPTPNTSLSPSQNPTASSPQTGTSSLLGLGWEQITIILLALAVIVLVVFMFCNGKEREPNFSYLRRLAQPACKCLNQPAPNQTQTTSLWVVVVYRRFSPTTH